MHLGKVLNFTLKFCHLWYLRLVKLIFFMGSSRCRWWLDDWMDPHCLAMAARLYSASELSDPSTDDVRHEVRKKKWSGGAGRIWRRRRQRRLGFFRQWRRLTASRQRLLSVLFALDPGTQLSRIDLCHISQNTSILQISVLIPKRNFRKKLWLACQLIKGTSINHGRKTFSECFLPVHAIFTICCSQTS